MDTSDISRTISEYETTWYFTDFWPGEYPPRFSVVKEGVVLAGRSEMKLTAAKNVKCPVPQFATFSPWNYERNALDNLQYKSVVKPSPVMMTESVQVQARSEFGGDSGLTLDLQEGDILGRLVGIDEDHALYRFQDNNYIIASAELYGKAQFEENPQRYDFWINLPAENGGRGWVLLSDAIATEGIIESVGADGLSGDLPSPTDLTLDGIGFASGASELTVSAKWILNQLAEKIRLTFDVVYEIGGHSDSVNSSESNQQLSYARAAAVADYLVERAIDHERFRVVGYGESQPIASNDTAEGREANRRVELRVLDL